MKRPDLIGLAAAASLCAVPAMAQTAASSPARTTTTAAKTPSGPGSLSGVWFNAKLSTDKASRALLRPTADGKPIPFQPEAKAEVDKRLKSLAQGRPFADAPARCLPAGVPQMMQPPPRTPLEIVETPGQVTVLFGSLTVFRIIRMNEKHPDDPDPTFMGNAVGHWDGDTLVVDTIGLKDTTTIDGVIPHSEDLHVVERLRRTGPAAMEDIVTIEDPKEFTKPYSYRFTFKREPGKKVEESFCVADGAKP